MATANTIGGSVTSTTAPLPVASTIDPVNDLLAIYTASVTATQGISRNTLLGLASAPVGLTDTQTISGKTLTSPTINGATLSGTLSGTYTIGGTPTFPASVVTLTGTQTISGKTLTSPTINSPTITNATISADTITGYSVSTNVTVGGVTLQNGAVGGSTGTFSALITGSNGLTISGGTVTLPANSITTADINAAAVTAAKMVNGMVANRQGGTTGAAAWTTAGSSNTNTSSTNVMIQCGVVTSSASSTVAVSFPTAYTQNPLVLVSVINASGSGFWATVDNVPSTTGCNIAAWSATGTLVAKTVVWIAIGQ